MKKNVFSVSILAATIMLSGCGIMGGGSGLVSSTGSSSAAAASSAASGLGSLASTLSSTSTQSILGGVLSTLLGNTTSQASILGTWTYSSPKVVFESESILSKIGSQVASSKIESSLTQQLKKLGFSTGKSAITFNEDGTYSMALGSKTYSGTYSYDTSSSTMILKGALGVTSMTCNCTVNLGELYMLFSADKLLSAATAVSSVNSTLSTLLSSYNGLKLGWAMSKQ